MPVFKLVARQKFAFEIYKVFIVQLSFLDVLFFCYVADKVVGLRLMSAKVNLNLKNPVHGTN